MSVTKYTKEHEWVMVDGGVATIGITDFAQSQLGDIVFIELPGQGDAIEVGAEAAVIESVKAAGEIKSPIAGTVTAVNEALGDAPETVNQDPMGAGWFFKLEVSGGPDLDGLLDVDAYNTYVEEEC